MAFSLYAATIPSYQQILGAVSGLLDAAEAFCAAKGIAPEDIIKARLAEDMLPFAYQVKSTAVHSLGAIEGVRRGVFSPDMTPPPESFAALKARIADTRAALEVIEPAEIDPKLHLVGAGDAREVVRRVDLALHVISQFACEIPKSIGIRVAQE